MGLSMYRFFYLVHTKNQLALKRHRFLKLRKKPNKIFTSEFCEKRIHEIGLEMKALTPEISMFRRSSAIIKIHWNCMWMMNLIVVEGTRFYYSDFKKFHDAYIAEQYLLGDKNE